MAQTLLFLCTGNYYRSRFAEYLFNWLARSRRLDWQADSRGIALEFGIHNVGPLSVYARDGLAARGVPLEPAPRAPLHLAWDDLHRARRVIALNRSEHQPMMAARFPGWAERIDYWEVPDLDRVESETALAAIERQVRRLVAQLAR